MTSIFKVQNVIAELDMMLSFSNYSKSIWPSCFPIFDIESKIPILKIENGKNPLDHNSLPN